MGVNLLEALRQGQVDVGLVQEPALTVVKRAGGRVLMNAMDLEEAKSHLGGSFEFMGVAVRGKEIEQRKPEMIALTKALADALKALRGMSGDQLSAPSQEMTTGLVSRVRRDHLAHRGPLPSGDHRSTPPARPSLIVSGLVKPDASISGLAPRRGAGALCLCHHRSSSRRAFPSAKAASSAWSARRARASRACCAP
jgi:NitT/TauT family transport system substrate-binding protein